MTDAHGRLEAVFEEHAAVASATRRDVLPLVAELAQQLGDAIAAGGKLIVFGNGGSAADAQHFAAELLGHFQRQRGALPALALTTDSSALTAIANDYAFEEVFARQVEALAGPADVVVGISTSGNAANVVRGIAAAQRAGARTWGLTGAHGGRLGDVAGAVIRVPSRSTARIQEMHITIIHALSELLDVRATEAAGPDRTPREA